MGWTEWSWTSTCADGWAHHNLAALPDGTIAAYHPRDRALVFFDTMGKLVRQAPCDALEAHDIAVTSDGLWLADCGTKLGIDDHGKVVELVGADARAGQVLFVDGDGATRARLGPPDHPVYASGGQFSPTGVAVDERGVWVADGYGSNLVHLVAPDGALLCTIDGFDCPHGIVIDSERGPEPRLYVADRGNRRVQVFDLDGAFVRTVGEGTLSSPSALAIRRGVLVVAELLCRITLFDEDDRFVEHVGANEQALGRKGWPNGRDDGDRTVPPTTPAGLFNSPHGLAVGADGVLYVTEWSLGGRWIRIDD